MRLPTSVVYAGILFVGILIGAGIVTLPVHRTVHADNLDGATAERVYRELSSEGSSLNEGSLLLSKIASVTSPSVVHIQSERRVQGRAKEEETGSGVILTSSKKSGFFVVTNGHVIDKTPLDSISIHLHDGRVIQPEESGPTSNPISPFCKIAGSNLTAAKWGRQPPGRHRPHGTRNGKPVRPSARSVTFGIISAQGRRQLKLQEVRKSSIRIFLP